MRLILCVVFLMIPQLLKADSREPAFNLALEQHLNKSLDQQIQKMASKLSVTPKEILSSAAVTRETESLRFKAYVRVGTSECRIEGLIALMEKSLRAVCIDENSNARIIF
ncbi:MAG: hypothetical protein A2X86_16440 [Bdellovibrionales bacterium GWA2_49_15]|nr:MAG: hypothetical protein A2X86_16440 [Bdellovibrionales bacterium GWA2_49_15]HAZ13694.1 hypothetical protein [Bdellovibrionales bacterium]